MGLLEIAVVLAWVAILLCLWAIFQLVAQNGRLLLRIESLERHQGDLAGSSSASTANRPAPGSEDELDEADSAGPPGVPPGTVLHDFELPDLDGRQHLRSDWLGRRLLMIFVSPHCRHSRTLLSDLGTLRASAPERWPLPLIVSTGSIKENRRLVERAGLADTVLVQEEMEVGALFEVPATPMAYLVDENGRTASPLVAGRAAILGLAASTASAGATATPGLAASAPVAEGTTVRGLAASATRGADPPRTDSPSADLLDAETTPAPLNGARYQGGLDVGDRAPSFDLPGLDGRRVALDQFRGRRVLLVFTDPSHPPCGEVVARLQDLVRSGARPGIVLIARGGPELNRAWAAEHGVALAIGLQRGWDVSREYGLLATPIAYLVDERGAVAAPVAVGTDAILDLATSAANAGR